MGFCFVSWLFVFVWFVGFFYYYFGGEAQLLGMTVHPFFPLCIRTCRDFQVVRVFFFAFLVLGFFLVFCVLVFFPLLLA